MTIAADRFYFRQLLSGADFGRTDPIAQQMVNFCYLIGDRDTGECVVVDPAYDVDGLLDTIAADGMELTGALITHYHPDHCGGSMMGYAIEGIASLLERTPVPIHVQRAEAEFVTKVTGVSSDLVLHDAGDSVLVDTLFLEGCGRTDLPGGDPAALYETLTQRLSKVPDDAVLFPGHRYSDADSASMGDTRATNFVFRPKTAEQWMMMFGH